jgi:membrane protein implicated in regulation of membrane protease activity
VRGCRTETALERAYVLGFFVLMTCVCAAALADIADWPFGMALAFAVGTLLAAALIGHMLARRRRRSR